jgi:hypothetical protein
METGEEGLDDKLALHSIIHTVPHSPIKLSSMEAERYLKWAFIEKGR